MRIPHEKKNSFKNYRIAQQLLLLEALFCKNVIDF